MSIFEHFWVTYEAHLHQFVTHNRRPVEILEKSMGWSGRASLSIGIILEIVCSSKYWKNICDIFLLPYQSVVVWFERHTNPERKFKGGTTRI